MILQPCHGSSHFFVGDKTVHFEMVLSMKEYTVKIKNSNGEFQEFIIQEEVGDIKLLKYLSYDINAVELPDNINEKPITVIGDTCFFNHPEIYSIQFPRLLSAIGNASFALCSRIKELVIPDSVVSIGVHAFRDCKGLKRVVMPKHLKVLSTGIFAFCYLSDDVQIILPEDLEEIEPHAFYSGGTFKLVIPKNVKRIGVGAFNWGPKVKTSLTFDKGWYLDWPYGERIILSDGQIGVVSDIKEIANGCEILDVNVDNRTIKVFYPCINGRDYYFEKEENQRHMEESFTMNQVDDLRGIYQAWYNGLI